MIRRTTHNAIRGTRGRRVGIPLPMANCAYATITSNNIIEMEGNRTYFEGEQTFHTADGSPAMLFTNSPFNDDHVQRFERCDNHERNGFPILMDDGFLSPVVSKGVKWAIDKKATPENHHNTTTTSGFDSERVSMSVKSHGGKWTTILSRQRFRLQRRLSTRPRRKERRGRLYSNISCGFLVDLNPP